MGAVMQLSDRIGNRMKLQDLHVLMAVVQAGSMGKAAQILNTCACRKLNPGILVMQPAQDWATTNVPGAIDGARDRCIFLQG